MSRKVSALELKRLLFDIRDRRPDVRIRVRLLGKMWGESFCSVDGISENEASLFDAYKETTISISNFNEIIQFELECSFFGYQAFYHYEVVNGNHVQTSAMPQDFQSTGSYSNSR
jgi:hypothetical protein